MKRAGLVVLAALTACASGETAQQAQARMEQESAALKTAAAGLERVHEAAFASGQPDAMIATFGENGREFPPNAPALVGREAIKAEFVQGAASYTRKLTVTQGTAMANGPLGIETGTYAFEATAKKGAPKGMPAKITDHGNFVTHWHNVNGTWQIADLIWTSSEPTATVKAMMTAAANAAKAAAKPAPKKATTRRR